MAHFLAIRLEPEIPGADGTASGDGAGFLALGHAEKSSRVRLRLSIPELRASCFNWGHAVFPLLGSGYGVEPTVARDPPQRRPRSWPQRRSISVPFFFWMCGWVMKWPGRRKFSRLLRGLDVASKVPPRRGSCGLGSQLYSTKQRNLKVRISVSPAAIASSVGAKS